MNRREDSKKYPKPETKSEVGHQAKKGRETKLKKGTV